jgi:hypothetical protein
MKPHVAVLVISGWLDLLAVIFFLVLQFRRFMRMVDLASAAEWADADHCILLRLSRLVLVIWLGVLIAYVVAVIGLTAWIFGW